MIHCVTTFKGDQESRPDYKNICLSYPFILDENNERRYLLFYRWIHWSLLLISVIFYLPRKVSKTIENNKAKKILEDLATLSPRYDQAEKDAVQRAAYFMTHNMRTLNSIYYKYLSLNIFSLAIDIFVLKFLDFLLQSRFMNLVPSSYPFTRDPENFKDYLSQTFPPFASCYLTKDHKILGGRSEDIGCHLTNMELYEKLFILFWFFIYALIIVTLLYNIYLIFMMVPKLRRYYISNSKPINASEPGHIVAANVLGKLRVGDLYMLYRLKQHLSPGKFYELLIRLGDPSLKVNISAQVKETEKDTKPANLHFQQENHNVRNRHPNDDKAFQANQQSSQNLTQNNNLLNQLLHDPNNQQLIKKYPELMKSKQISDKSILIDCE
ncbi:UNVERIFIED_CONTAM: hypothetical protein GTU68_007495 [Idotea baltica]|nr:hypothetical protein [Idotea baltica]